MMPVDLAKDVNQESCISNNHREIFKTENIISQVVLNIFFQEPQEAFWGLKKDWWQQLYDGKYHKFGKRVFDEGLHSGDKENGYYKSAKAGCRFACSHLKKTLTTEFYKELHKITCAHFDGNSTAISTNLIGKFLAANQCRNKQEVLFMGAAKKVQEEYSQKQKEVRMNYEKSNLDYEWHYCMSNSKKQNYLVKNEISEADLMIEIQTAKAVVEKSNAFYEKRLQEINAYIAERCSSITIKLPFGSTALKIKSVATLSIQGGMLYVYYQGCWEEEIVDELFNHFNATITTLTDVESKIRCIADLFQMLEWLHPFGDGQGRTDLILLSKLLCENGLHPAILDEPFVSTYSSLDEWVAYLKQGLIKWEKTYGAS
jgi:hypothetical protein